MKDKTYLYYECDTMSGKIVLAVEVDYPVTLGEMIGAEKDLKNIILDPCEKIIQRRCAKPRRFTSWEPYKKPWCLVGIKTEKVKIIDDGLQ